MDADEKALLTRLADAAERIAGALEKNGADDAAAEPAAAGTDTPEASPGS